MKSLPEGTVALLFSDIEGSTRLLLKAGDQYPELLGKHRQTLRAAFSRHGGAEVDTQGDAFFVAFSRAEDAVAAAADAQRSLADGPVRVRIGVHVGQPVVVGEGYVGLDVHRGARICAAAHGGQVLLSGETVAGARATQGFQFKDLGEHRLKDLPAAERLFQLVVEGIPSEFPPLRTLERPTNLPAAAAPLIGRDRELAELHELLNHTHTRLVTLTGPGGVGKSRLAIELARSTAEPFAKSGIFIIELATVLEAIDVPAAVARALSVREEPGRSIAETLAEWLRDRDLMLVIDNFEHVLDAAPVAAELLAAAKGLTIVATSRSPLRLRGEHVYDVAPLQRRDGVALFAQRARAAGAGLDLMDDPTVSEICERLDGLPLAIELAAARMRTLPPRALLQRLDHRLDLLSAGTRDAPGRQQTLRATIDWSYELLAPAEQELFARVSAFTGGFTLDAAEAVATGQGTDLLNGLDALVEASLLRREERDGDLRFTMLETIHEYALELLAKGSDENAVRRLHSQFFRGLVEEAEPELRGSRQRAWLERLERDRGNLETALAWVESTPGEADAALRLASSLAWFWIELGDFREAREALERVLAHPDAADASAARAKALATTALLHMFYWDAERAEAPGRKALDLARRLGAHWPQALALNVLGTVARVRGDHELARTRYQAALALDHLLEDRWPSALALFNLGIQAFQLGADEQATAFLEQGLALSHLSGDRFVIAMAFDLLARVAHRRGDLRRAAVLCEESLAASQALGNRWITAICLEGRAEVDAQTGNPERAARLLGAEDALRGAARVEMWGTIRMAHGRTVEQVRAALGEKAFAAAFAAGGGLSSAKALALALDRSEPAPRVA